MDIDILVQVNDLLPAAGINIQLGYTQVALQKGLTASALRSWAQAHKDLVFRKSSDGLSVKVLWGFLTIDDLRPTTRTNRLCNCSCPSGVAVNALTTEAASLMWPRTVRSTPSSGSNGWADFAVYKPRFGATRYRRKSVTN